MELSVEQQTAFDTFVRGKNLFITGPAGSGKSELIKHIYKHAIEHFKSIQICALTGSAAVLIGCKARTLHSWAGIGLANDSLPNLIKRIKRNKYSKEAWTTINILVVDEVSMMSKKLFDILNLIGKTMRRNNNPFGGIQLVFCGDFYQLPPVGNNNDDPDHSKFCFESDDWNTVFLKSSQVQLVKVFRQKDSQYISMLNKIRRGKITHTTDALLKTLVNKPINTSLITKPTRLFPVRKTADMINNKCLSNLDTESKTYSVSLLHHLDMSKSDKIARSNFTIEQINLELEYLSKNILCDQTFTIKIGAQVMSIINIKNDDNVLIVFNGSQGIVTNFCQTTGFPYVKFNSGIELLMSPHIWMSDKIPGIGVSQVPLILAWAITIHKSQGASLDAAEIDIGSDIFEGGQSYVALSRVKSLDGLYLTSYDPSKIKTKKIVKDFYHNMTVAV